ncbi:EcsC family protein [Brevibacillus daliensis]|uniref:EcsC family protein n=1 Tax=Brevibacillus daliensis TaxID=2892995 RepID=UPI001E5CF8CD|nr:EcsC family protein [Brevibacillus daliensis]
MKETKEYLHKELDAVLAWEQDQKDLWFWEKIGRLPFVLLDRVAPKMLKDKVGEMLNELGAFIQSGGKHLISEKDILNRFPDKPNHLSQVSAMPLTEMDQVAKDLGTSRTNVATVQGASTGFGGMFTLAIDIPMIIGLSLKVLQEIAIVYGFDPHDKTERVFIIKCLQFASADLVGKKAILDELADMESKEKHKEVIAQIQGWREVSLTFMDNMAWKKLFQMIPIAGMFFGAYLNRSHIADIAETGHMLYRKRRILHKLQECEERK